MARACPKSIATYVVACKFCAVAAATHSGRVVSHALMSMCPHQSVLLCDGCARLPGSDLRHFPQPSWRHASRVILKHKSSRLSSKHPTHHSTQCGPSRDPGLVIQQPAFKRKGLRFPGVVSAFQSDVPLEQQIEPPASGPKFRPFTPQVLAVNKVWPAQAPLFTAVLADADWRQARSAGLQTQGKRPNVRVPPCTCICSV